MIFTLFKTFFYIGIMTFGGGYGMIPIAKEVCVDKNKWITSDEFLNVVAIAESTPGPIAVNLATYVGYKISNLSGSIFATFGVLLPSFIIIYVLSFFLNIMLNNIIVFYAFQGIRIAVVIAIFRTALNLISAEYKKSEYKKITLLVFFIYLIISLIILFSNFKFNSVILIISSIILGILLIAFSRKEKI